jgi:hypothetical protein
MTACAKWGQVTYLSFSCRLLERFLSNGLSVGPQLVFAQVNGIVPGNPISTGVHSDRPKESGVLEKREFWFGHQGLAVANVFDAILEANQKPPVRDRRYRPDFWDSVRVNLTPIPATA